MKAHQSSHQNTEIPTLGGTITEEPLLTAPEIAQVLRVSTRTIMNWVADRKIPFMKVGPKCLRFRRSQVLRSFE